MANKSHTPRGIRNSKLLDAFADNGCYKRFLELVAMDDQLDLQIRSNYINIYYRGHNLARIESPNGTVQFSEFYFLRTHMIPDVTGIKGKHHINVKGDMKRNIPRRQEIIDNLRKERDSLKETFRSRKFDTYITEAKKHIDAWLVDFPKAEREEQQEIINSNTKIGVDYTIIDIEFQTSTLAPYAYKPVSKTDKRKSTRFDLIAIDKHGQVYVIELKKGCGACTGKSGLADHVRMFKNSIGRAPKEFLNEMSFILKQKKEFGIIKDNSLFIDETKQPLMVFAYSPKENEPITLFEKMCKTEKVEFIPILECNPNKSLTLYK